MPELPIVIEPAARSYLLWGALGGGIVLVLVYGLWESYRRERLPNLFVAALAAVPFVAFGVVLMLQPVGWYCRIDETGMTLHAPFELFRASRRIAWAEVTDIRLVVGRHRASLDNQLEIIGQHGSVIEIGGLYTMPKSFAAPLVAVFTHYAPQARLLPDVKGFTGALAAKLETEPLNQDNNPTLVTLSSYRVRVGEHVLK